MIRGRNRTIEKVKELLQLGPGQEVERLFMSSLINW